MLKQAVKQANNFNISCFSIACNTAHVLLPQLQAVSKIPFISMIDETVKQVHKDKKKRVGLLGTPSTIRYGLYQTVLSKYGISAIVPTEEQIVILENIIRNIISGKKLLSDRKRLILIANSLKKKGAQGIILGCTELPLIFPNKYSLPIYNSIKILAKALLRKYYAYTNE